MKVKIFKYQIDGKVKASYHLLLSNLYAENNISVNWMAFIVYSLENIHMASREKPFSLGKTTKNLFCRKSNHETVFKNAWWVSLHDLDLIGLFIIVLTEIGCLNNLLIYEIMKFYQAYNYFALYNINSIIQKEYTINWYVWVCPKKIYCFIFSFITDILSNGLELK